eukprot:g5965.t1
MFTPRRKPRRERPIWKRQIDLEGRKRKVLATHPKTWERRDTCCYSHNLLNPPVAVIMDHFATNPAMGSTVAVDPNTSAILASSQMDCHPKARSSTQPHPLAKPFQPFSVHADVTFWKEHTTPTLAVTAATQNTAGASAVSTAALAVVPRDRNNQRLVATRVLPSMPASARPSDQMVSVGDTVLLHDSNALEPAFMTAVDIAEIPKATSTASPRMIGQQAQQSSQPTTTHAMLNLLAATAHPAVVGSEQTLEQSAGSMPIIIPSYILASMANTNRAQPNGGLLQKLGTLGAAPPKAEIVNGAPLSAVPTKRLGRRAASKKIRPFLCLWPGCGERFPTHYSLKRHFKRHSGDRPHACTVEGCNGRFAEKSTLQRHLQMHNGERPFRCKFPYCGRRYADRLTCQRHEENYHSGEDEVTRKTSRDSMSGNDSMSGTDMSRGGNESCTGSDYSRTGSDSSPSPTNSNIDADSSPPEN